MTRLVHRTFRPKRPNPSTHCKRGHEYTPENTYVTTQGNRQCRACNAIYRDNRAFKQSLQESTHERT